MISSADALGVRVTTVQAQRLLHHLELVHLHGSRMNLTTIRDWDTAILAHIVDSLAVLGHLVDLNSADSVADLGSGAGYPGVPLAIMTSSPITLIESVGKKSSFLEDALLVLGLREQATVLRSRVEEVPASSLGSFGFVTARALTSLPSLVELSAPLLRPGGRLVAMKGRPDDQEVEAGSAAGELVGMRQLKRVDYQLPVLEHGRSVFIYEKSGSSDVRLPRRPGVAQRRPLA